MSGAPDVSSPEALDELMALTSPASWAALFGLGLLVAVGTVWCFIGRIRTDVSGPGLIVPSGGILDVAALSTGPLLELGPEVGDVVERGQLVARIAQPELEAELARARSSLEELHLRQRELERLSALDEHLQASYLAQKREQLQTGIDASEGNRRWLEQRLTAQLELLKKGLLAEEAVHHTRLDIERAVGEIRQNQSLLRESFATAHARSKSTITELRAGEQKIGEAARAVELLEERLRQASELRSPHTGRVIELRAGAGDVVSAGAPLLNLEPIEDGGAPSTFEVVLYLPSGEGKKVHPGMIARISPSTVAEQEFGFMIAEVTFVSDYPATMKGMMRTLENEELVRAFLTETKEPPLTVRAHLTHDPRTPSGFKWSSGRGPSTAITSGTPCQAAITVREQSPASLILPLFAELL